MCGLFSIIYCTCMNGSLYARVLVSVFLKILVSRAALVVQTVTGRWVLISHSIPNPSPNTSLYILYPDPLLLGSSLTDIFQPELFLCEDKTQQNFIKIYVIESKNVKKIFHINVGNRNK